MLGTVLLVLAGFCAGFLLMFGWIWWQERRLDAAVRQLPKRPWSREDAETARVRLRRRQAEELTTVYRAQSHGLKIPMGLMQSLHQKHAAEWAELELTAATDVGVTV